MSEITRVPLQPIAKGSVGKLWIGVAALVLAAGGVAWASLPVVETVETVTPGLGASPTLEDVVLIKYKGTLPDGKVFDQSEQTAMPVAGVVPGFSRALLKMQKHGSYKIHIPWQLGYGDKQAGPIPAKTDLDFEVTLIDFRNRAEVEREMQMMQQMQQMRGAQQRAPGAPPAGAPELAPELPGAPPQP